LLHRRKHGYLRVFRNRAVISTIEIRQLLKLLALVPVAGCALLASAQLPPANVLLTEPRPALITLGPADVHLRASAAFTYNDEIRLQHEGRRPDGIDTRLVGRGLDVAGEDFIFSFSPGVNISKASDLEESRTLFSLDYSPDFIFFVRHPHENSIDHSAKFKAGYGFTKLTLGLSQDFDQTSGEVVDVGSRVRQMSYRTGVNARYELSEKTFLNAEGTFSIRDYEELTDSQEWSMTPTANYQITPKVTLGLGLSAGQLFVDEQHNESVVVVQTNSMGVAEPVTNNVIHVENRTQTQIGPTLRASYKTTEKTDVSASVGGEWRTYDDGGSDFGPVFSLSGTYQPWQGTRFSITAHRREQNSAVISGANFVSTGVSFTARQQLMRRLSGHFRFSYDHSSYKAVDRGASTSREDDYYLLRYGLDAILGRSWTIGLFHQYRDNVSSEDIFSYSNNQVGIQAAWGY
jgi:hypothetical protein